jgi:hypothetical protein
MQETWPPAASLLFGAASIACPVGIGKLAAARAILKYQTG